MSYATNSEDAWIVNNTIYDLSRFALIHPGGSLFIDVTKGRDITSQVYTYHSNPDYILTLLQKYKVKDIDVSVDALKQAVCDDNNNMTHNTTKPSSTSSSFTSLPLARIFPPSFLWPELNDTAFVAYHHLRTKIINYNSDFYASIRNTFQTQSWKQRIQQADEKFDFHLRIFVCLYIFSLIYFLLFLSSSASLFSLHTLFWVFSMTFIRTSLSCGGHYALHRAANKSMNFFEQLFEYNYVTVSFIQRDAHSVLHHAHTESLLDAKHLGITRFREVPVFYRFFAHSMRNIGLLLTGYLLSQSFVYNDLYTADSWLGEDKRSTFKNRYDNNITPTVPSKTWFHRFTFFFPRIMLLSEVCLFYYFSCTHIYFCQYLLCLWYNTFVVCTNHDYAHLPSLSQRTYTHTPNTSNTHVYDWARMQISGARDFRFTPFPAVDAWLTAGLSCHRVHHLLPYQKTAYGNILVTEKVREICAKFNIVWEKPLTLYEAWSVFFHDYICSYASIDVTQSVGRGVVKHDSDAANDRLKIYENMYDEHFSWKAIKMTILYALQGFKGEI